MINYRIYRPQVTPIAEEITIRQALLDIMAHNWSATHETQAVCCEDVLLLPAADKKLCGITVV